MNIAGFDEVILTREQQRLLGGWRDILDDVRNLCRGLGALPDACTCGQGSSHLSGSCPCCHAVNNGVPLCADCDALLGRLSLALDTLLVDTLRFFPVITSLLHTFAPETVRVEGTSIERHIGAIYRSFSQLVVAAAEFRAGCRASHLQALKVLATDLLAEVNQLDRKLEGQHR